MADGREGTPPTGIYGEPLPNNEAELREVFAACDRLRVVSGGDQRD